MPKKVVKVEPSLLDRELFCPLDGKRLVKAKWQDDNRRSETLICPSNHLWDISEHSYIKGGLEFHPVKLSQCECGEVMPERDMRSLDDKKTCPACYEIAKKAWRMDKDKSYARLEITPIRTTDGVIYQVHTSIEIKPYPNPFMYGGMWGSGGAKDEQELQKIIQSFEQQVAELKENGMERVEVVRHDEVIHTEQVGLEKPVLEAKLPKAKPVPEIKAEKPKQPVLL